MRRGIATFQLLAVLALASGILFAPLALLLRLARDDAERNRPAPVVGMPESVPMVSIGPANDARGVPLAPQDLPDVTLTDCRLVGDWRGRDLRRARLWECDLTGAILDNSQDPGFGPSSSPYRPTDLTGALYDVHTRWPEGFDPVRHGARLRE